jgi:cellulose synthase (UDP-forming)
VDYWRVSATQKILAGNFLFPEQGDFVMGDFYFSGYENRVPPQPPEDNKLRGFLGKVFSIATILATTWYILWRWTSSINYDALWFSIPLVIAETFSYVGILLMFFNLWDLTKHKAPPPVRMLSEIEDLQGREDRPIKIDVFIATYNEEVELVRYSIMDAKRMEYPFPDVKVSITVLDDGRRDGRDPAKENMKSVCEQENVGYLTRETNEGYKAGNLKNGIQHTDGDLFVILDADTRPFRTFLNNTTGYFRDHKMAWVQTTHWFYDTTQPRPLGKVINWRMKVRNPFLKRNIERVFNRFTIGRDIFGNDPRIFYEIILNGRNCHNAAFCCGAASVHRREAVMDKAVRDFAHEVSQELKSAQASLPVKPRTPMEILRKVLSKNDIKPFKYHASEDIYTSMILHSDSKRWKSWQHPWPESKMLSPQDLATYIKQRSRYASGSLDMAFNENPLLKKGLDWRQKLCYLSTIFSYFSPLWLIIFLASPIVYFFSQTLPVMAYSRDFFTYFLTYQVLYKITMTLAFWKVPSRRGEQYYVCGFYMNLLSLWAAIRRTQIKFNVTPKSKKRNEGNFAYIWPHMAFIILTVAGMMYNAGLIVAGKDVNMIGFVSNVFWGGYNIYNLSVIVRAAYWKDDEEFEKDFRERTSARKGQAVRFRDIREALARQTVRIGNGIKQAFPLGPVRVNLKKKENE